MYKKVSGTAVIFLVLYVHGIIYIGNDIRMSHSTEVLLSTQFSMKEARETSYVL